MDHRQLGRSGLRVSPLALGTMTFANDRWGSDDVTSRAIFDRYVADGGNVPASHDSWDGIGRSIQRPVTRDLGIGRRIGFHEQQISVLSQHEDVAGYEQHAAPCADAGLGPLWCTGRKIDAP